VRFDFDDNFDGEEDDHPKLKAFDKSVELIERELKKYE